VAVILILYLHLQLLDLGPRLEITSPYQLAEVTPAMVVVAVVMAAGLVLVVVVLADMLVMVVAVLLRVQMPVLVAAVVVVLAYFQLFMLPLLGAAVLASWGKAQMVLGVFPEMVSLAVIQLAAVAVLVVLVLQMQLDLMTLLPAVLMVAVVLVSTFLQLVLRVLAALFALSGAKTVRFHQQTQVIYDSAIPRWIHY